MVEWKGRWQKLGFEESKIVLKGNNLKSRKDYEEFIEKYPMFFLPKNPESKFNRTGQWKGWYDFLGVDGINPLRVDKIPYEQAKKLVRELKIKTSNEYFLKKRTGKLPLTLPYTPKVTYKNEWRSWHEFLGTKPTTQNRQWTTYEKAKKWARKNNIRSQTQWLKAKRPVNIPSDPARIYK